MTTQDYAVGDPRRVLAAAKAANGSPLTELLWGCQDPDESLRMSRAIAEGGWLAITLSEHGANAFRYLKGAPGTRAVYFVKDFAIGGISEAPMLLGYFMSDFEGDPDYALRFPQGDSNRVYFRKDGPGEKDKRVEQYSLPTEDEIDDTARRLDALVASHPAYTTQIDKLREALDRQDSRVA